MRIISNIPRAVQPKFHEGSGLRSERDADSNAQLWKRNSLNVQGDNSVYAQLNRVVREVNKLRRRQIGYQLQEDTILPFQMYQTDNKLSAADSWRTFQMRDGLLGARSRYSKVNFAIGDGVGTVFGNYENELVVVQDQQSSLSGFLFTSIPISGQIELSKTQDTLIVGVDGSGNAVGYSQFLPAPDFDDLGQIFFSIYLEIIDSPTPIASISGVNLYANLKGRMFAGQGVIAGTAFDVGQNIIPIAIGFYDGHSQEVGIIQIQTGNCVNRFPAYSESTGFGQTMNFLGDWTAQSLSGQLFYPCDTITSSSHLFYRKTFGFTSVAPTVSNSDWTLIL